jgi:hypothetical protein
MDADIDCGGAAASHRTAQSLSAGWRELCSRYLPVAPPDSIWRYSRVRSPLDPDQGWKLHVSATVLNANRVLERVGTELRSRGVLFKAPASLRELNKLSSGLFYGYTQVGKFLTIYPRTGEEAVSLAELLHGLTRGMAAPAVPFDLRYRKDGCVYYRYGAFTHQEIRNGDGTSTLALRDPAGRLVPDSRESWGSKPEWVSDPFAGARDADEPATAVSPLKTTYRVFRALQQRGKGGVYQAVDLSVKPPRLCILKEGRRHGEPWWDGRDGYWRVKDERKNLRVLRAAGIEVPCVYSSFEVEGHFYLVTEFVEGYSLDDLLGRRQRRLPVRRALQLARQVCNLVARMHKAGWVWRDCKPSNLLVTRGGTLRPLDFEGACRRGRRNPLPWVTPSFAPPEVLGDAPARAGESEDLYALGVLTYYLLTGSLPPAADAAQLRKLRRNVPADVCRLVSRLLDPNPLRRPRASTVARRLGAACRLLEPVATA